MNLSKIAPWVAGGLALVGGAVVAVAPGPIRGFDVHAFSKLPVLEGGRLKPLDTVARNSLLMIRGQQSFRYQDRTVGADEWLLDVLFRPQIADAQPIFVINDPDVLGLLGIRQTADRYFSFQKLAPYIGEIQRQAQAAHPLDAKERSRFQSAILNLFDRMYLYHRLKNTVQLEGTAGLGAELEDLRGPQAPDRQAQLAELAHFRPLSPLPGTRPDAWRSTGEALRQAALSGAPDPELLLLGRVGWAYSFQDPGEFNRAVAALRAARPGAERQTEHEELFNRAQPFYVGMVIYVLALLAIFASWLVKPDLLRPAGFGLLVAGAAVQTAGLVSRILLQGRPPVTNLYSSAVFVGWAAVLLSIVLERIYKRGFGIAVGAAAGFASLLVAHHLAGDGDTMEMMRAVLDSNFWLATHVVAITIGYSGTFLAGAIAIAYTLRKHLAPRIDPAGTNTLVSMTYGIVAFSVLFSFVGTVLGGIWADQSWGRFWGWDPKENGALLIVLWNAIILHARFGGFVRERGLMTMAIFGNVITSLSWFGVNMLGVGLHSYGFMDKAFWALSAFIGVQFALMGLCLLPRQFWRPREAREVDTQEQPAKA